MDAMNVLIVGAGKSGVYLAEKLRGGHEVTLVESRPDRVDYVASRLPGCRVIRGDGCEPIVLDRAGEAMLPTAGLVFEKDDVLFINVLRESAGKLERLLGLKE